MTLILLVVATLLVTTSLLCFRKRALRQRRAPPTDWRVRLWRDIPQAGLVPVALRPIYERRIEQFLLDKRFIGCGGLIVDDDMRSEEHTSELPSLMRISYAVFCLKKKTINTLNR